MPEHSLSMYSGNNKVVTTLEEERNIYNTR
jgi:hypothetical protein